ncbi:hypothetical protein [Paenibacillus validus]|uniref:hypothetical protein n=1 Tax=Paenibacillus validus TaxID=44253 RepID=UPI000FD884CC
MIRKGKGLDSSRTMGGAEDTTADSLDVLTNVFLSGWQESTWTWRVKAEPPTSPWRSCSARTADSASIIAALRKLLATVLVEGVRLFPDGGWKISSTRNTSRPGQYICALSTHAACSVGLGNRRARQRTRPM